ncbi:hypothetical protein [Epilithonimonas sp.]|uniref:hypothetical protein n=1 Tax=Epilithonimonas sp. TaxID=2894511 RepID=UPI002FDCACAC
MKIIVQILKWISISILGIFVILVITFFVYEGFFYKREMNHIKEDLNKIENVEVIEIWGHEDVTLEEVSTRLRIKNKGEIVLYGLSKDVFNYPENIQVTEIGGYSFTTFSCNGGIGSNINIGNESELFPLINKEFKTVKDVIENYDFILEKIKNLKKSPEINYFESQNSENYILVHNKKSVDQDPIFNLVGVESLFDYAKTLKWNNPNCYYNKN